MYALWNAGDLHATAEFMNEEIEYVNPDYAVEPGVRKGRAEVTEAIRGSLSTAFDSYEHELREVLDAGNDTVLVLLTFRARGRDSGAQIEVAEQHLWTFREGKATRLEWFHDEAAARRAAGLL
jgi:ketosteroid isomerase-like protein